MSTPALYDVPHSFKDIHKVVLDLANTLNDEQLNWKPEGTAAVLVQQRRKDECHCEPFRAERKVETHRVETYRRSAGEAISN